MIIPSLNRFGDWLIPHLGEMSIELLILAAVVWGVIGLCRIKKPVIRHLFLVLILLKPMVTIPLF